MATDVHIDGRGIDVLPEWRDKVAEELAKVQRHAHEPILHARVEFMGTGHHRHGAFELCVVVSLTKTTLTIKRRGAYVLPLIVDAFNALDRVLREHARMREQKVKVHEAPGQSGQVARVLADEGYGFIETADGLEVYFHANAVKKGAFEKLAEGVLVEFALEMGEEGPQAAWVKVKK
jgi:cold shock CspA family protein